MTRPATSTLALVLTAGVLAASTSPLISRSAYDSLGGGSLGAGLLLAATRLTITTILTASAWIPTATPGPPRLGRSPGPDRPGEARRFKRIGRPPLDTAPTARSPEGTGVRAVAGGLLLGLHFATWLPSLAFTSIAASTTIVTTGPVWVALMLWARGRRPSSPTLLGISVAVAGGALVAVGGGRGLDAGSHPLLGNALALVAAVAYAGHLLLARSVHRRGLGLWRWTAAVSGIGALAVAPLALLTAPGQGPFPPRFWLAALALALGPQLVGHSAFSWSVRWLSPTLVSVLILAEPLLSSVGGAVLFDEVPGLTMAAGAVVLVIGVGLTTVAEQRHVASPEPELVSPT